MRPLNTSRPSLATSRALATKRTADAASASGSRRTMATACAGAKCRSSSCSITGLAAPANSLRTAPTTTRRRSAYAKSSKGPVVGDKRRPANPRRMSSSSRPSKPRVGRSCNHCTNSPRALLAARSSKRNVATSAPCSVAKRDTYCSKRDLPSPAPPSTRAVCTCRSARAIRS